MVKIGDFEVFKEEVECLGEQLLISEPPTGSLIFGSKTMKEIEEEKKQFNKMKLLEKRKETIRIIEEINSVQPMDDDLFEHVVEILVGKPENKGIYGVYVDEKS